MKYSWGCQKALAAIAVLGEIYNGTSDQKTRLKTRSAAWEVVILAADLQGCPVDDLVAAMAAGRGTPKLQADFFSLMEDNHG